MSEAEARDQEPVTITDKRKIDPETGAARPVEPEVVPSYETGEEQAGDVDGQDPSTGSENVVDGQVHSGQVEGELVGREQLDAVTAQLDERTADLQRLQAEFANYKRRVVRDREVEKLAAKASIAGELLGVLDDLDRARSHGDLQSGPMKAVADKLHTVLGNVGLEAFGVEGDTFDPSLHEAVQHEGTGHVQVVGAVLRKGYKFGDRVLRNAMVSVVDGDDSAEADQVDLQSADVATDSVDKENINEE
ncbi:nucleotide exchange factor GrpE [Hoyosella rhizosphaerae]|uniref:Protein GrpE n=1 Tax=Hoyosella rhizosphaerae TaxID=1755582 RepID=A0A916U6A6_9ACTN|nr:nucleotide exchange factor GrpE [Hoyosella rhizosphaerae]MBN4927704.1 nucleotide exchange factor GrpE [Hoyosella rhizosphaerae]GGC62320.1 protein GrpE [Hoyosella rhizosphaerae]